MANCPHCGGKLPGKPVKLICPQDVSPQVWSDFLVIRRAKRAPLTETALKGIRREAEKAGIPLERALSICAERGWQSFKAEWTQGLGRNKQQNLEDRNAGVIGEWVNGG